MRITFLLHNAYAVGGTIRTTFNLAGALAGQGHEVEIASVFRHREKPVLALAPEVPLRHLVDLWKKSPAYEGEHPLHQQPAKVFPAAENRYRQYSRLTDERIGRWLAELDADVVVGTRPGLNVHIARQAPRGLVRVAQEHLTLDTHPARLILTLRRLYPRLDAVTTTTDADAAAYRRRLPGVRVQAVPNSVPDTGAAPSDLTAKYVVAAGRLVPVKRYGDLIRAFGKVVTERPDWGLRIYGGGIQRDELAELIEELQLGEYVRLMGQVVPIEPEMAKGSILAVSSAMESFGMTIVEGMTVGLPVVSTDCPLGPGEIIDHGRDGLLVPPCDLDAMAAALLDLIGDDDRRRGMGRAALEKARHYDPDRIARVCADLFEQLLAERGGMAGRARRLWRHTGGLALGTAYLCKDVTRAVARRAKRAVRAR
jgi:glycosyltransferase involved in cell wall biosynthesis